MSFKNYLCGYYFITLNVADKLIRNKNDYQDFMTDNYRHQSVSSFYIVISVVKWKLKIEM